MTAKHSVYILVVDDDKGHREMLHTLLTAWGYQVTGAEDGDIAVDMCKKHPFDLVLMDVRMPKKSGVEALKGGCKKFCVIGQSCYPENRRPDNGRPQRHTRRVD